MNESIKLNTSIVKIINHYQPDSFKRDDLRICITKLTGLNKYQIESAILDLERIKQVEPFDLDNEFCDIKAALGLDYSSKFDQLRKLLIKYTKVDVMMKLEKKDLLEKYQKSSNHITNFDIAKLVLFSPAILTCLGFFIFVGSIDFLSYLDYFKERVHSHYYEPNFDNSITLRALTTNRGASYFDKVYIIDYQYEYLGTKYKEYSFSRQYTQKGVKVKIVVDTQNPHISKIVDGSYTPGKLFKGLSLFEIVGHIFMYGLFWFIAYREWKIYQLYRFGSYAISETVSIDKKQDAEDGYEANYSFYDADHNLRNAKENYPMSPSRRRSLDYDIVFYDSNKSILRSSLGNFIECSDERISMQISNIEIRKKLMASFSFAIIITLYAIVLCFE